MLRPVEERRDWRRTRGAVLALVCTVALGTVAPAAGCPGGG